MAWYKEWFGEEYLELYSHRDRNEAEVHIDFVERVMVGDRPRAVLDLACGAGRHNRVLRRRGYRALGVDLSLTLLSQDPTLPRVAGDMCSLPFAGESFDWVLNFFTSFGYFEQESENFQVLVEVERILAPGGAFLIDLFNRDLVVSGLRPKETTELGGKTVEIDRWFDERRQRINKRIRVHSNDLPVRTYLESVRAYTRAEVVGGLERAGLSVVTSYGGFDGEEFNAESPRLILVAKKLSTS